MTEILNLIDAINGCQTLDDLRSLLGSLDKRELSPADERVLRSHLQSAARRLMRLLGAEKIPI